MDTVGQTLTTAPPGTAQPPSNQACEHQTTQAAGVQAGLTSSAISAPIVALPDRYGNVQVGAVLTTNQSNTSRPRWTKDRNRKLLSGVADGKKVKDIAREVFGSELTKSACGSKIQRLRTAGVRKATDIVDEDDPGEVRLPHSSRPDPASELPDSALFKAKQVMLFTELSPAYRASDCGSPNLLFQHVRADGPDLHDLAEVLADYRAAEERVASRDDPTRIKGDKALLPMHVVLVLSIGDHQSRYTDATGGAVHDWQPSGTGKDCEYLVYFAVETKWTVGRRAQWRGEDPFGRMRCSDARGDWMWHEPSHLTLPLVTALAKPDAQNDETAPGDATYTTQIVLLKSTWRRVMKCQGSALYVILCMPNELAVLALVDLVRCSTVIKGNGRQKRTLGFNPTRAVFRAKLEGSALATDAALPSNLLLALKALHGKLSTTSGPGLERWSDTSDRIYAGQ